METKRVRIALMINDLGEFEARGWGAVDESNGEVVDPDDTELIAAVRDLFYEWERGSAVHTRIIEAEIDVPQIEDVEGEVVE